MCKWGCVIFAMSLLAAVAATAGDASTSAPTAKKVKACVAIFDLAARGDEGKDIADKVRIRLARHEDYDVVDGLTTKGASEAVPADAKREKLTALMDQLAVNVAVYGTVTRSGKTVSADIRCLDLTDPKNPVEQGKTFTDSTERYAGEIARMIVQTVTGQEEWVPPQYGDEPEPDAKALGKPLNVNGDFEKLSEGWDPPDNVSTFVEKNADRKGTILRVQTDLQRDPWLEYTRNIRLGLADPAKPPTIKKDTSYGSVAGLEGVHYRSAWIKAEPLTRYWLLADHKGPGGAKVFVKGYRDTAEDADGLPEVSMVQRKLTAETFAKMPPADQKKLIAEDAKAHPERYRRECYRWYLNCDKSGGKWKHFAAPMPPRGGLPKDVQWLQIQIYSYWPPGEYLWDNVLLYKDPAQKGPVAEEPAKTPNFGKAAPQPSTQKGT